VPPLDPVLTPAALAPLPVPLAAPAPPTPLVESLPDVSPLVAPAPPTPLGVPAAALLPLAPVEVFEPEPALPLPPTGVSGVPPLQATPTSKVAQGIDSRKDLRFIESSSGGREPRHR